MSATDKNKLWFIPAKVTQLADGSTMIRPGKAILRTSVAETERLTGLSDKTLTKLADEGLIRRCKPSEGKTQYYPAEAIAIAEYTETHPDFWENPQTRQAYLAQRKAES